MVDFWVHTIVSEKYTTTITQNYSNNIIQDSISLFFLKKKKGKLSIKRLKAEKIVVLLSWKFWIFYKLSLEPRELSV